MLSVYFFFHFVNYAQTPIHLYIRSHIHSFIHSYIHHLGNPIKSFRNTPLKVALGTQSLGNLKISFSEGIPYFTFKLTVNYPNVFLFYL